MRRLLESLARNWRLKLAALGISLLLWSVVKAEETVSVYVRAVPVTVSLRDPAWQIRQAPAPQHVTLLLTGPVREVLRIPFERPRVVVPVEEVRDSAFVSGLRVEWVHLSGDLARTRVDDILPAAVRLTFHRVAPDNGRAVRSPPVTPAAVGGPPAPAARDTSAAPADSGTAFHRDTVGERGDRLPAPAAH